MEMEYSVENEIIEDIGFVDENNIYNSTTNNPTNIVDKLSKRTLTSSSRNGEIKTLKPVTITPQLQQKKKISYDDLLSNMGMTLVNGKLELYNISKLPPPYQPPNNPKYRNVNDYTYQQNRMSQQSRPMQQQQQLQQQQFQQQQLQQQQLQQQQLQQQQLQQQQLQQQQLQQQQFQQQQFQQQEQEQPMTKQQYKKYLALEYLKNQEARNRIGQIKSKKLLFPTTGPGSVSINSSNMNRFFSFNTSR